MKDVADRFVFLAAMYSTCLFCNKDLGRNEVIEDFPVGRRLAYDPAKGRLWVVCRKCERWNLSPLEERWEAIEEAERLYRDTRLRVATENIGLARLTEGLELVRIGEPLRPEFAAWRYGDQFGRRRKRAILYGAAGAVLLGGIVVGGAATGILSAGALSQTGNFVNIFVNLRARAKIPTDDGKVLRLRHQDLRRTRIIPGEQGQSWGLELRTRRKRRTFHGEEAFRVAGLVMPKINRNGARASQVQHAVKEIEEAGHPDAYLEDVITRRPTGAAFWKEDGQVARLAPPTRLAIEMALHEEQERRALEGELKALEAAWRRADEIAGIADNLLLPEGTEDRLEELKRAAAEEDQLAAE